MYHLLDRIGGIPTPLSCSVILHYIPGTFPGEINKKGKSEQRFHYTQ